MSKRYFKLFANCVPVKGASVSIICDLQRGNYMEIPNELFDLLEKCRKNTSVQKIQAEYEDEDDREGVQLFLDKLRDEQLGFYTSNPKSFIDLPDTYRYSGMISNCIIDCDRTSTHNYEKIVEELESLNCGHLQFRFYDPVEMERLNEILDYFNQSSIRSIEVILPFASWTTQKKLVETYKKHTRLLSFQVFGAKKARIAVHKQVDIQFFTTKTISVHSCGVVGTSLFAVNINHFFESRNYNSCLNGKISIDAKGAIRNCPGMGTQFGNIQTDSLLAAALKKDFQQNWRVTKDQIEGCKDCQFRYICTDCRAYVETPENGKYSKPLKCGYDPYTNEWADWKENPIKQRAIDFYGV